MLTIPFILVFSAFVIAILAAIGKAPLWVSVILVIIYQLLQIGGVT